jgi:hypothetical protein
MMDQIAEKMKCAEGDRDRRGREAVRQGGHHGARRRRGHRAGRDDPTGSLALDLATGIGGYPRGRVVEIYGPESSGKTTLALHAIAEAQRAGAWPPSSTPSTRSTSPTRAGVGVETDKRLLVSQPDTGEQALDITEMLVRSGAVDLIVIDSVAALTPKAELEGEMGDAAHGASGAPHEPGLAQAHRGHPPHGHDAHVHEPAPPQDRRHVRLPRDDDGRQRAQVLRVDAPRRPSHRPGEGGRRAGRGADAGQDRQEQVRSPVHRGRVRDPLGHRGRPLLGAHRSRPRARAHRQDGQPPVVRRCAARQRSRALARHARRPSPRTTAIRSLAASGPARPDRMLRSPRRPRATGRRRAALSLATRTRPPAAPRR